MGTVTAARGRPAGVAEAPGALRSLRRWNVAIGLLHAAQAAFILALASDFSLPVTTTFLEGPPGSDATTSKVLYDLPIGPAVAVFLLLAAVDHLLVASPRLVRWYERNLAAGQNPARWWEYSLSASLMIVLIAMLTGISELSALLAIFGVNAAMILFGLLMETVNRPGQPVDWRPFVYGSIVGAVPWLAIAAQIAVAEAEGTDGGVPTFVFAIFVTLFVAFFSFAVNMALQYKGVGRWRDYLFGERAYLVLSLVAKTLLAWQVFASALAG
jgi:hypothetical protein